MIIEKSLKIKFIQKCKCGAVTIRFNNGASNSMRQDIFEHMTRIKEGYKSYPISLNIKYLIIWEEIPES